MAGLTVAGVLVCLFAVALAAPTGPKNIFYNGLAVTLIGPPYSIQLQPLYINDLRQQWTFDADGFITNVFDNTRVFDVEQSLLHGGVRIIPWTKKCAQCIDSLNQRWTVNADNTIESKLIAGYFLGPDADATSQFLEVDYNVPAPKAEIKDPINPYVCTSYNDPHITKFPCTTDRRLEAHEFGRYSLANFGDTRVSANHVACYAGNPNIACNDLVNIRVGTRAIEIRGDTVTIGGTAIAFATTYTVAPGFTVTRVAPGIFRVETPNGIIETTGALAAPFFLNIKITATNGLVPDGGLCACKDGPNRNTTTTNPTGRVTFATTFKQVELNLPTPQFVHSWKYRDFCEDPFYYPNLPVGDYHLVNPPTEPVGPPVIHTDDPVLLARAQQLCAALLVDGPLLQTCAGVLDPAGHYENCVNDVIATEDPLWAARVIDAYASHCSDEGHIQIIPHISAARTIAFGPGLGANIGQGETVSFTIQSKDVNGNNRAAGGETFTITAEGPAALTFAVVDNGDGTYTVTYTAAVSGEYTISILHRDVDPIQGNPFQVTVVGNDPDVTQTEVTGAGIVSPIFAGDTYTFIIQLKLPNGQNKATGGDNVQVTVSGPQVDVDVHDNENGSYTVTYIQNQLTTFTITIKINNIQFSQIAMESW